MSVHKNSGDGAVPALVSNAGASYSLAWPSLIVKCLALLAWTLVGLWGLYGILALIDIIVNGANSSALVGR